MTQQAINSLGLYKGTPASTIEQALSFQKKSVVDELKEHFGVTNNHDLAVKLSNQ